MADPQRLDTILRIAVGALLVAVLALGGWFGYTVYSDRVLAEQTTPALRLLGAMKLQVKHNPNDASLRVRLGEAYAASELPQQAIEQFNAALKIEPKHTGALLDLGYVASSQNRPDEARNYFQKVISLTEGDTLAASSDRRERAFYQLGLLEYGANNYDTAVGDFKSALRIRNDASDTYFYLAHALDKLGQRDEALRNVSIALQFDPNFPQALYFAGLLYLQQGDRVNASLDAGRAAQLSPGAPEPKALVAQIGDPVQLLADAKAKAATDVDAAIQDATVAANLDPTNVEPAKLEAELLLKAGRPTDALKAYQAAAKLAPHDTEIASAIKTLKTLKKKK